MLLQSASPAKDISLALLCRHLSPFRRPADDVVPPRADPGFLAIRSADGPQFHTRDVGVSLSASAEHSVDISGSGFDSTNRILDGGS